METERGRITAPGGDPVPIRPFGGALVPARLTKPLPGLDSWRRSHACPLKPWKRWRRRLRPSSLDQMTPGTDDHWRVAHQKPPEMIRAVSGAMLAIDRIGVPPALVAALKHLASLHNPEYYEKERLRFSTWNTPRFLRCYGETIDQLLLPRGIADHAARLVREAGSTLEVTDACPSPTSIEVSLQANLTDRQQSALDALIPHHLGVLVAPPGSGKTVIACGVIAHRQLPTLIVVDRQPLVEQWRERLGEHLGMATKEIGQLGGGRNKAKGTIDIAMAQSLARREDLGEIAKAYGLVIVDECHHVPAVTFERVVRQMPVRHWLGLTATPYRRDHLEKLITMYCGAERHRMTPDHDEGLRVERVLVTHTTGHEPPSEEELSIQAVFRSLVEDEERSRQICGDVASAIEVQRNCLVLTQWTEHLESLSGELQRFGIEAIVMRGGMGRKARASALVEMQAQASAGGLALLATGSFLGEGFDLPRLDTLFLAFPLAFKGRIVQYVGRDFGLRRENRVEVHDYVDINVPVLARMQAKRLPAYVSLGFPIDKTARRRRKVKTRSRKSSVRRTAWIPRTNRPSVCPSIQSDWTDTGPTPERMGAPQ